jgi:hypothetical protein
MAQAIEDTPPLDPLDMLLRRAAARSEDAAVRRWLEALLGGERASGPSPAAKEVDPMTTATATDAQGYCSVASLGRGRWFWVVWPSLDALCAGEPAASGTADDKPWALEAAGAAAAGAGIPGPLRAGHSGWALDWRRVLNARAHQERPAVGAGVRLLGFVYRHAHPDWVGLPRPWTTHRHRVLRRTAARLYVAAEPEHDGRPGGIDRVLGGVRLVDQIVLDRRRLEAGEEVWHAGLGYAFTLDPDPPGAGRDLPRDCPPCAAEALELLGLSWPCTAEDVTAAYRKRSLEAHPDRGGSKEAMQAINEAHHRLKRLVNIGA